MTFNLATILTETALAAPEARSTSLWEPSGKILKSACAAGSSSACLTGKPALASGQLDKAQTPEITTPC